MFFLLIHDSLQRNVLVTIKIKNLHLAQVEVIIFSRSEALSEMVNITFIVEFISVFSLNNFFFNINFANEWNYN